MPPATHHRRRGIAVAAAAACALAAFTPPATARTTGAPAAVSRLAWSPCRHAPRFDCATLRVPVDYREPEAGTIALAVIRRAATRPGRRIGSLFFHPGLRGDGTVALPEEYASFPRTLRERFDIIAWDARGTGRSRPVRCFRTAAQAAAWGARMPAGFPVGERQRRAWIGGWAWLGRLCGQRYPRLLRHISAADTARDLDVLRAAAGERRLNFLGTSYGTMVGATYANLFPGRVRAMVLDSAVDPASWMRGGTPLPTFLRSPFDVASGRALGRFLAFCGRVAPERCAFTAGSPRATRARYQRLMRRLREHPQGAWTYARTVSAIVDRLRTVHPGWTRLGRELRELWEGRAPALEEVDVSRVAQEPAAVCGESPNPRDPRRYTALERYSRARAGDPGSYWTWRAEPCATWPARAVDRYTGPWDRHAAPVLTIGITHDPATPYRGARAMTRLLGRARLLTVDGDGHISLLNPSACVRHYESRYFVRGTLPPRGEVCRQDAPPFAAPGRANRW